MPPGRAVASAAARVKARNIGREESKADRDADTPCAAPSKIGVPPTDPSLLIRVATLVSVLPGGAAVVRRPPLPSLAPLLILGGCSASMKQLPRPSVRRTKRAANWLPWPNCAGTSRGSRTTRTPGFASERSRVGDRCLNCRQRNLGGAGANRRRRDQPCPRGWCGPGALGVRPSGPCARSIHGSTGRGGLQR